MKKKSDVAVIDSTPDIRTRMNETLASLTDAIQATMKDRNTQEQVLSRWKARVERAKVIVEQTSGEGQAAAQMLLEQAEGYVATHQKAYDDEAERLTLLQTQHQSMEESVNKLDAVNRVKVLQERIKSINPATRPAAITTGDDEKAVFDQREIEKDIHMINALIELRKEQ